MIFNYNFYKTPEHRWYADIPEWTGTIDDLEMVSGADTMLDILSQGENKINISFSDNPLHNSIKLSKINDTPEIGGAEYLFTEYLGIEYNIKIWLCDVTKWVFDYLPEKIWII